MKIIVWYALLSLTALGTSAQQKDNRLQFKLRYLNKALSDMEQCYDSKQGKIASSSDYYRGDIVYVNDKNKLYKISIDSLINEKKWSDYSIEIASDLFDPAVLSVAYFTRPMILLTPITKERSARFQKKLKVYRKILDIQ